jgi:hypothetical protein
MAMLYTLTLSFSSSFPRAQTHQCCEESNWPLVHIFLNIKISAASGEHFNLNTHCRALFNLSDEKDMHLKG